MTSEDPIVDGAVAESAGGSPSDEGEGATKDKWRQALDRYLEGNLDQALTLVDAILREDPTTDLRPRLERLKRRALDRLEKGPEGGDGAPAVAVPAPQTPAAEPVAAAPAAAAPAAAAAAPSAPAAAEAPSAAEAPAAAAPAAAAPAAEPAAPVGGVAEAVPEAKPPTVSEALGDFVGGEADAGEALAPPAAVAPAPEVVGGDAVAAEVKEAGRIPETGAPVRRNTPGPGQVLRRQVGPARRPAPASPAASPTQKDGSAAAAAAAAVATAGAINGQVTKELDKVNSAVNELGKVVRGIESSMMRIAEAYQRVAKDGKRKDQAYDQLYEELKQYKDDWLIQAQKPLFRDVILFHDSAARQLKAFEEREGDTVPKADVLAALKNLKEEVLEALYRRDVERIEDTPPKLAIDFQKPVRRVDTEDPAQDKDLVQVLREGFRLRGAVLRPQEVVVKRLVGPAAPAGGAASGGDEAKNKVTPERGSGQ